MVTILMVLCMTSVLHTDDPHIYLDLKSGNRNYSFVYYNTKDIMERCQKSLKEPRGEKEPGVPYYLMSRYIDCLENEIYFHTGLILNPDKVDQFKNELTVFYKDMYKMLGTLHCGQWSWPCGSISSTKANNVSMQMTEILLQEVINERIETQIPDEGVSEETRQYWYEQQKSWKERKKGLVPPE